MAKPAGLQAVGNVRVVWVPTIANAAGPTAAEVNATGAVDLSCYLTSDGFALSWDESTVEDARLCEAQTFSLSGRTSVEVTLRYTFNPTSLTQTVDNKAATTLLQRTKGNLVVRWGTLYTTAFAAGQKVDVYPVECGVQQKQSPEANSVLRIEQTLRLTDTYQNDVTIAA